MKKCIKCKIEKDFADFPRHKGRKDGYDNTCKSCKSARAKAYRAENGAALRERERQYYLDNQDRIKANNARYREKTRKQAAQRSREWRKNNAGYHAQYHKEWRSHNKDRLLRYSQNWRKNNPAKVAAANARRRSAKIQATPAWLTEDDWKWIYWHYKHAKVMTEMYGVSYHVDHIHPLRGKVICGLHVPLNLQVITKEENEIKGNSFNPES